MIELKQTETFRKWRMRLRDERTRGLIASRLDHLVYGHVGDVEPVGQDIGELRIHYGPGYRLYFFPETREHYHRLVMRWR